MEMHGSQSVFCVALSPMGGLAEEGPKVTEGLLCLRTAQLSRYQAQGSLHSLDLLDTDHKVEWFIFP